MTAYAIAHFRPAAPHPEIFDYIEKIQATLDPFGGRFLVHGSEVEVTEGDWPGTVVVIAFPDLARARGWYDSPAYAEILPLRTRHIDGDVVLVPGVPDGYDPAVTAARLRAAAGPAEG
ncbi:Uncharacterized conserved protein, DUF1330 family [Streptomyces sp. 2224.1]|uniref:DUF1330 domain-containing protein n=1 Tax=unclassified Streptomyces TaxID=2593676 RepID=UPI0008801F58|nr:MULTISPECIES: DUF1330 domain-containing protein [unclassified Streptomyces]PBC86315.1 uncharacterized protein (DUF1330 family) [Streptomyces sp. 2321.6]SDQ88927.1 Uncharacterized conserved protein, DUF1330 family [Streptomyces sp. KS_16]SED71707.1 Uncharacterized conserved protein, DUF1330 family [Streptomyces sp. 2112.3]SED94595.1 Uncharacterized conserved protein, DUF1330 family [Streptomyces sp. 2133.1]SED94778.1 Uncharacterized conserved protein, DUF1330 family [Streptomyces sp. 2224.1]